MGVEIVKILHGGVGGDVEQGARTSKQISLFAFAPIVSLTLSHLLCAKHHTSSHIILACVEHISYCLALIHIAISLIAWLDCVCSL